jgi:hypothetical protein
MSLAHMKYRIGSRHIRFLVVSVAMLGAAAISPAQSLSEEDFDDENKPWQEIAIHLPIPPKAGDLLPVYVSATATQTFTVDAKSLTVGPDGVIRYTLVATSPHGASNISYEGIRCRSFERKTYAFGQPDGGWTRSRRDQWEGIVQNAANRHHAILAKDYFCRNRLVAGSAEKMIERIRSQQPLTQQIGD